MSKSASNLEVREEADVFPKTFTSLLLTGDRQLDALLRRVQGKITERVSSPWSTMQKSVGRLFDEERGLRSPQELERALLHFHVQLNPAELQYLFQAFATTTPSALGEHRTMQLQSQTQSQAQPRFDYRRFVGHLFPSAQGTAVAPNYGSQLALTRRVQAQQREAYILAKHRADAEKYDAAMDASRRAEEARMHQLAADQSQAEANNRGFVHTITQGHEVDPSMLVYPYGSQPPPAKLLARSAQAEAQARAALDRAFDVSRSGPLSHRQRTQRSGVFAASAEHTIKRGRTGTQFPAHRYGEMGTSRSTLPPPPQRMGMTAEAPLPPPPARATSSRTRPTFHLPVPHRERASAAVAPASNGAPLSASSSHYTFRPYAERKGTSAIERWAAEKGDAYVQPGISFGSAYKF